MVSRMRWPLLDAFGVGKESSRFGFCLFFSSIILILAIFKENINVSMVFFLLFMFVMGATIVYSGFESEADSTKRDLEKILCIKK